MKGFLVLCLGVTFATACLSFFILFQGDSVQLKNWWEDLVRESESLPLLHTKIESFQTQTLGQNLPMK